MFARLRFFVRQAFAALGRSLGITALAALTIGLALAVLATFAIIVDNLSRVAEQLGRDVEISAYLVSGAAPAEVAEAQTAIGRFDGVAAIRRVDSAQAMAEFRNALGKDAVLLDGLPPDILPSSLEVRLTQRPWTTSEVRVLSERIAKLDAVDDVRFGQEDIERIGALLGFARISALVLGAALSFATILIISNTIRLTVYARRDEIEIMSLVGATNAFVRAPFVLEGAIQGFIGGLIALGGLVALHEGLEVGLERGLSYAYGPIRLDFAPAQFIGYLLAAGVLLGLVGSVLAVGRFLKV